MTYKVFSFVILVIMLGCTSREQSKKSTNKQIKKVDLYERLSPSLGTNQFFEKESQTPYNGKLKSKTKWNQTFLTLKNGFFDGDYLTMNLEGDTLELVTYSEGKQLIRTDFKYVDDSLTQKVSIVRIKGDNQDFELFRRALDLILNKEFDKLNKYLPHTFDDYQRIFEKLTLLFGSFEGYTITKITKECYAYNNSEHLRAELLLNFNKKKINVSWLIVETKDELIGQAFTFPYFQTEISPNNLAVRFVRAFNNDDGPQLLNMLENGDRIWDMLKLDLKRIKEISTPKFLYCFLRPDVELIKVYSIEMDGKEMHLCLNSKIENPPNNQIASFSILPIQRLYNKKMERVE